MEKVQFRLIHFNNGMHGWDYSKSQYKSAFPQFLHARSEVGTEKRSLDLGQHHASSERRVRWSHECAR
jgi:hypothetical protein